MQTVSEVKVHLGVPPWTAVHCRAFTMSNDAKQQRHQAHILVSLSHLPETDLPMSQSQEQILKCPGGALRIVLAF